MSKTACPGQDTRFWQPGDIFTITCSKCGKVIEFFKDEATRLCKNCGNRLVNPKLSMGCAQWCDHAEKCLGYDPKAVSDITDNSEGSGSLMDRLIESITVELGQGSPSLEKTLAAFERAEKLLVDSDVNPRVVLPAILLIDVSPEAIRDMMANAGMDRASIEETIDILNHLLEDSVLDTKEFTFLKELINGH